MHLHQAMVFKDLGLNLLQDISPKLCGKTVKCWVLVKQKGKDMA